MSAHRAPAAPLRLTRRGRIVRDMVAGGAVLGAAVAVQPISVAFFTVVVWVGQVTGLSAGVTLHQSTPGLPVLFTVEEVARALRCSEHYVRAEARAGRGRTFGWLAGPLTSPLPTSRPSCCSTTVPPPLSHLPA